VRIPLTTGGKKNKVRKNNAKFSLFGGGELDEKDRDLFFSLCLPRNASGFRQLQPGEGHGAADG
jgi:hypothetical protein